MSIANSYADRSAWDRESGVRATGPEYIEGEQKGFSLKLSYFTNVSKTLVNSLDKTIKSHRLIPTDVILFLTYRCTSKCTTCNIWQRSNHNDLEWEEWEPILQNLADSGIESIELFGGDALIRRDLLVKMIRFCTDHGIDTYFPTNSNLLDEQVAKEFVDAGLGTIYFSLDELPSIDGSVRGVPDHYQKVVNAINLVKKHRNGTDKPRVICITTVSKWNHNLLEELYEHVQQLDVDGYVLRGMSDFQDESIQKSAVNGVPPEPYFVTAADNANGLSLVEAEQVLSSLKKIHMHSMRNGGPPVSITNMEIIKAQDLRTWKYPKVDCLFCTTQAVITPSGDVVPCVYYNNYILGNLKNDDVRNIWGNQKHREFCNQQQSDDIDLCNYCSIKFYHPSFGETVRRLTRKFKRRMLST